MSERDFYVDTLNVHFLGFVLRKLRELKQMTLRELADRVPHTGEGYAIDPSTISLVERGERVISYVLLQGLAKALSVEPKWLIVLALPMKQSQSEVKNKESEMFTHINMLGNQMQEIISKKLFNESFANLQNLFVSGTSK